MKDVRAVMDEDVTLGYCCLRLAGDVHLRRMLLAVIVIMYIHGATLRVEEGLQ